MGKMIPVGYMAKHLATRPDWLKDAHQVKDIYSVSGCISENFADYIEYWKHNGYWLFDSPQIIEKIAKQNSLDIAATKLFFYEAYEFEYDEHEKSWKPFDPDEDFVTKIHEPDNKTLEGFDVATFWARTKPECSPLSCNSLAKEIETDEHCLLPSFDRAKELLEDGKFENSERGPYRIFAVYSVPWP